MYCVGQWNMCKLTFLVESFVIWQSNSTVPPSVCWDTDNFTALYNPVSIISHCAVFWRFWILISLQTHGSTSQTSLPALYIKALRYLKQHTHTIAGPCIFFLTQFEPHEMFEHCIYIVRLLVLEDWRTAYMAYSNCLITTIYSSLTFGVFCTCFILASSLRVCSSFLRSFLFPTRMMGTLGQKCFTSGVHFSGIFSVPGETWSEQRYSRERL